MGSIIRNMDKPITTAMPYLYAAKKKPIKQSRSCN